MYVFLKALEKWNNVPAQDRAVAEVLSATAATVAAMGYEQAAQQVAQAAQQVAQQAITKDETEAEVE